MLLFSVLSAHAFTADVDGLVEGASAASFTNGQLLFRDLDNRYAPTVFSIERADATLGGQANFTPLNVVGFGGYASGPDCAFGRFGSMVIEPPQVSTDAEITIWTFGGYANTGLTLEAWSNGAFVARDSQPIPSSALLSMTLAVSVPGGFDELRVAAGPNPTDVAYMVFDHVVVTGTPSGAGHTGDTGEVPLHTGDTGGPDVHSGGAPLHTGEPDPHTGLPTVDTGEPATDDGPPDTDAAPVDEPEGGCSCATRGSVAGLAPAVLALLALRRRRRR